MLSATLERLSAHIDQAVPPLGGPPKVTGPQLNAVLQEVVQVLAAPVAAAPATYRASLLFAQGDDLLGPDYRPGPATLRTAALSPGAVGLAVSVDDGATFAALPLAAGARTWQGALALPAGASVWYQVEFAPGASRAGVLLTLEEPASL
jgi:hypothetical protein